MILYREAHILVIQKVNTGCIRIRSEECAMRRSTHSGPLSGMAAEEDGKQVVFVLPRAAHSVESKCVR